MQLALTTLTPWLFEILTTGDRNENGIADESESRLLTVRVGVITSIIGLLRAPALPALTCADPFGDDGLMVDRQLGSDARCATTPIVPRFLEFDLSSDDSMAFAADVGGPANVGGGCCAYEQQLEAILKALTTSTSSVQFPVLSGGAQIRTSGGP